MKCKKNISVQMIGMEGNEWGMERKEEGTGRKEREGEREAERKGGREDRGKEGRRDK